MIRTLLGILASLILAVPVFGACVAQSMSCNTTVQANLESSDCVFTDGSFYDVWQFQGTSGQVVTIDMSSTPIDTYLALLDPNGNAVAENDDRDGTTTNSRITFTLTGSGLWTIIANSFDAAETGAYSLSLSCGGGGGTGPCTTSGGNLCVNNGRYRVSLSATNPSGRTEPGVAVSQTNLFGWFSLPGFTGNSGNPEIFVKVLGPVNGVPWVFYAGLTNLAYNITVVDTTTGAVFRTYSKPAPPSGSSQSYGDFDVASNVSQQCSNVAVSSSTTSTGTCANTGSAFCLLSRFSVTMTAKDNPSRTQNSGPGQSLPVNTNFGFFSVPALSNDATNIEAFVKLVDGRTLNNRFWVFLGGLTDFELTITVTDTQTGQRKIYTKPAGSTCGWNDTNAF